MNNCFGLHFLANLADFAFVNEEIIALVDSYRIRTMWTTRILTVDGVIPRWHGIADFAK
jgi:hypothetical protein